MKSKSVATKSITLVCTLELDPNLYNLDDFEEKKWLYELLVTDKLWLHSDEIGDILGQVRVTDLERNDD